MIGGTRVRWYFHELACDITFFLRPGSIVADVEIEVLHLGQPDQTRAKTITTSILQNKDVPTFSPVNNVSTTLIGKPSTAM